MFVNGEIKIAGKKKEKNRINEDITAPKVRLIDKDGENKGVVSFTDAIAEAKADKLDLVEIVPNAKPPVVRIMDYGRFKFDESKKRASNKKKQKKVQLKEIKFRPATDVGDYNRKINDLRKFLLEGNKAKVTIRFRGREMAHRELGRELLERAEKDLEDCAVVEQFPKMEGRQMMMMLGPIAKK